MQLFIVAAPRGRNKTSLIGCIEFQFRVLNTSEMLI